MGVEVVEPNPPVCHVGITLFHQPAHRLREVKLGAPVSRLHMPPASQWFDHYKEVGRALAHVLIVAPLGPARGQRLSGAHRLVEHDGLLVEANGRVLRVVGLLIQVEYIFHCRYELGAYLRDTPLLVLPGLKLVLAKRARMVSGEMRSTKPNSTALPASMRSVQWSWPAGTGLYATAIRCACCSPVSAWRHRSCTLSVSSASTPPARKRTRTRLTVLRQTSKASSILASLQPSPSLSGTWARTRVRALLWPRWTTVCRRERSKLVKVTAAEVSDEVAAGMGCSFHAHELTTFVRVCVD